MSRNQILALGGVILVCVTLVITALIFANTDFYIKNLGTATDSSGKFLNTVSVSGDGKVFAKPDMAEFSITVSLTRESSKDALEGVNTKVTEVQSILKNKGIEEDDIQTSYFNISPEYDWTDGGRRLLGQKATQTLSVKVKDIDEKATKVAEVIDEVMKITDVELGSINFDIEDKTEVYSKARELAYKKAEQKAKELASLGGVKLGKVVSISDISYDYGSSKLQSNVYAEEAARDMAASDTSISTGQLELNITVNVNFEIE